MFLTLFFSGLGFFFMWCAAGVCPDGPLLNMAELDAGRRVWAIGWPPSSRGYSDAIPPTRSIIFGFQMICVRSVVWLFSGFEDLQSALRPRALWLQLDGPLSSRDTAEPDAQIRVSSHRR